MSSQISAIFRNRQLMIGLVAISGFVMIFQTYFPTSEGKQVYDTLTYIAAILAAFFTLSGSLQLFRYHAPMVMRREPYWQVNAWSMFCAIAIFVLGLTIGVAAPFVNLVLYSGVIRVVATAMTVAQAWIGVSVIMRYSAMRNADLTVFSLAIFCNIVFQTPVLGTYVPWLYDFASWMRLTVGGTASTIQNFTLAIAGIMVCTRILLGRETGFMGRVE